MQIFGSEPQALAGAAKLVEAADADIIDINMGCPTPKIVKNGEGSALMTKPELAYELLARVVDAVHTPVTVKIRKGWDERTVNAVEIAILAEKAGVAAIAVHGRTREQYYSGQADWNIIRDIKENVSIPVIGNGDIRSARDAAKMLADTGCDCGDDWTWRSGQSVDIPPDFAIPCDKRGKSLSPALLNESRFYDVIWIWRLISRASIQG